MFACLRVCLLVAYLLRNGWTDLAKLFFVSSVLGQGMILGKKIPDPVFSFSGSLENSILAENYEIFLQNSSTFQVKIAEIRVLSDFTNSVQ